LNISNALRKDTAIHVVLEGPPEPPKTISFYGAELRGMAWDERSIAEFIKRALSKGRSLAIEESVDVWHGVKIAKKSFEALVKTKAAEGKQIVYLHKKGADIRNAQLHSELVVVFGDYIGMPRATEKLLDRLGAERISLGPKMLFAAHCIIIVHNELDRRGL